MAARSFSRGCCRSCRSAHSPVKISTSASGSSPARMRDSVRLSHVRPRSDSQWFHQMRYILSVAPGSEASSCAAGAGAVPRRSLRATVRVCGDSLVTVRDSMAGGHDARRALLREMRIGMFFLRVLRAPALSADE
eukprot:5443025-Prymnesium_polylepis.2